MKTRRYIFYSIVYVALIWVLVFSILSGDGNTGASYSINILGYELSLPIATWFALPVAVFALLSLFHIAYYGMRNFFDARALKSDQNLYNTLAKEIYLGMESNKEFKTDLFATAGEVTKSLSPWLKLNPDFRNEELANAYDISSRVRLGEACDLKRYKLLKTNPLFLQNEKNKIDADYKYALEMKESADESLNAYARAAVLANATWSEISKFDSNLSAKEARELILRKLEDDNFDISSVDFSALIEKADLNAQDYVKIALSLVKKYEPDQVIGIFKKLKDVRTVAMAASLLVFFEFQQLDELRDALAGENAEEFERIQTLLFLRENGKRTSAELFYK